MTKPPKKKLHKTKAKSSSPSISRDATIEVQIPETRALTIPTVSTIVPSDPLVAYLNEIRRYPLLTPEQERELAIQYFETQDRQAAEKLITSNLRFVVKIAAEYSRFGAKMIDLVQEGNVGLMHAVKEFNPYRGVKLITYAVWWIRGYIREYLMRQHSMVRIGTTQAQKKLFYNLQRETRALESQGETATPEMIGERLGVPEKDVREMKLRLQGKDVSLETPVDDDGNTTLLSFQKDERILDPEEDLVAREQISLLRGKIDQILPSLNEKELYILERRLLSDEPLTLQEVGDHFKITRERARQLEARILSKIKEAFLAQEKPHDN